MDLETTVDAKVDRRLRLERVTRLLSSIEASGRSEALNVSNEADVGHCIYHTDHIVALLYPFCWRSGRRNTSSLLARAKPAYG